MSELIWTRLEAPGSVAQAACDQILQHADSAIRDRERFRIVLAGGSTPQLAYSLLSKQASDWSRWEVYFGDERCLPEGHEDLNFTMARRSLLDEVPIDPGRVYPIESHLGAEQAADRYRRRIRQAMPFDMVLLGMGEDGHTASIFPGHPWQNQPPVYAVHNAPKPPPDRVTLSSDALGNARKLLYLVTGEGKAQAVSEWRHGKALPINSIETSADCEVLIDAKAAATIG